MTNTFVLTKCRILYPNIYAPRHFGDSTKYGVGFSTENRVVLKTLSEHSIRSRNGEGAIFNAQSNYPPLVTCKASDYRALSHAFKIAELRNMSRDRLFRNVEAEIVVSVFNYEYEHHVGTGLSLSEVVIDAQALKHAALNYTGSKEEEASDD